MTNKEFVTKLQDIATNYKTVYMLGCFGSPVTSQLIASKAKQLPMWYTSEKQAQLRKLIGKGYFAFDCVNLIKQAIVQNLMVEQHITVMVCLILMQTL